MKYTAKIGDKTFEIEVNNRGQAVEVKVDGQPVACDFKRVGDSDIYSLIIGYRSYQLHIEPDREGYLVHLHGLEFPVEVEDERTRLLKSVIKPEEQLAELEFIKAPMPGLVVKVEVEVGQRVKRGDGVAIVEAMKMENEIKSPMDGVVKEIRVKEREAIDKDAVLVVIG